MENRAAREMAHRPRRAAMTLIEVIVVLAAGGLLLGMIAPALHAARRLSYDEVCLNNLRELGGAIHTYAAGYDSRLPGPLHPGIYQDQRAEVYQSLGYSEILTEYSLRRQAVWLLSSVLGDSVNDRLATCPVLGEVVNAKYLDAYSAANYKRIFPLHYTLNNYGGSNSDPFPDKVRRTNPWEYFGYNPAAGSAQAPTAPRAFSEIPNASAEWMVADAWYRARSSGSGSLAGLLSQDGPYQVSWSGVALPFWAPHGRTPDHISTFSYEREVAALTAGRTRQDGATNTVFMDGHAGAVPSRAMVYRGQTILYGFPGTVNLDTRGLPANYIALLQEVTWE